MAEPTPLEAALSAVVRDLSDTGKPFALVGGLAVSVRAEVRFTRDVDVAVSVASDAEAESLVHALGARGYRTVASVEHEGQTRLATVRLLSAHGVKVNPGIDLASVRQSLALVHERGFDRNQNLYAKLAGLLPP